MGERLRERIESLVQEVAKKFESTGLVTNVKIKGFLNDPKNPLHLEYRIKGNSGVNEKGVRFFRTHLVKLLLTNHYQISEVKADYHERGLRREIVVINNQVRLDEETEAKLRYGILEDIKKELTNYLERKFV